MVKKEGDPLLGGDEISEEASREYAIQGVVTEIDESRFYPWRSPIG